MNDGEIPTPRYARVKLSEQEEFQALALYTHCLRQFAENGNLPLEISCRKKDDDSGLTGKVMTEIVDITTDQTHRLLLYITEDDESGELRIALDTTSPNCSPLLDFDFLGTISKMP